MTLGLLVALTPRLPLGLTLGLPLGPQPYNPFVFGPGPKARVATAQIICIELQGQHHEVVLAFVQWAAGLTCLRTLPFACCRQDFGLGLNCFALHVAL
jgi:hypothetical protein